VQPLSRTIGLGLSFRVARLTREEQLVKLEYPLLVGICFGGGWVTTELLLLTCWVYCVGCLWLHKYSTAGTTDVLARAK